MLKLDDLDHKMEFPNRKNVVYVLFYGDNEPIPFYVGETDIFGARMADYIRAQFGAPTDFKVGEAIRYLAGQGIRIQVGYEEHPNRQAAKRREAKLVDQLERSGVPLLNSLPGFKYLEADKTNELKRVHDFCIEQILAHRQQGS
jgi:hypothetical protein